MNIRTLRGWLGVGCALWLATMAAAPLRASVEDPRITSVRLQDSNIVVTASVPAGLFKVTLESRSRLGAGAWQPRAVARLDGSGGDVTFHLARSEQTAVLRIRADVTEPLPASFYRGTNRFGVQPATGASRYPGFGPWEVDAGGTPPSARTVEESDLWKRRGDTLYVFNQYRGLRVIDVAQPDQARITGTLELPAAGDQMYLLGDHHAVLLGRERCYWDSTQPESEVVIVDTSAATPAIAARLPVWGRITESRLVGTALYLASETYRLQPDGSWFWGVVVTPVDLADPAQPVTREAQWFPGYGQAVAATPELLFVATPDPGTEGTSTLHCLDITAPDGRTTLYASLPVFGRVPDKFKMDWTGGILRVVSERQVNTGGRFELSTRLETFRMPDPRSMGPAGPGKLGEVELVRGERLFASRFDGLRAYVVTYRVVDPLWVVDLSDPAKPRIAGELHVPGWSTYIQPFGDRLLSVGIDDANGRRVAISMFDVKDPAAPALIKRVSLGEGWSWSEANSDEKAVTVLPEVGLLLVPYVGSDATGGAGYAPATSRVKLIDFDLAAGTLTPRGEIPHQFDARRTMLHQDRVLSLSSSDLLSADVDNRDEPAIRHTLALAWSVDRLLAHGPWLIEISTGDAWGSGSTPAIRIAPATDPNNDRVAAVLPVGWPIMTASTRDGRLYVTRGEPGSLALENPAGPGETKPNLELRVYDLLQLPDALPLLSETKFTVKPLGWWPQFKPLWVRPDLLVLAGGENGWWWGPFWGAPALVDGMPFRYWRNDQEPAGSRLIALNVAAPAQPGLASDLDLAATDRIQFSPALAAGGLIYVSHGTLEAPVAIENPKPGGTPFMPPEWFRVWHHQLTVVDLADPANPTVRPPVELPGALKTLGADGNLLYTVGSHWVPDGTWSYDATEWLDATAYDGVAAHLVASLKLPAEWPHPLAIDRDVAWLGRPPAITDTKPALEGWSLNGNGEFALVSRLALPEPPNEIRLFETLLAAQSGMVTRLIDVAEPATPKLVATRESDGCLWLSLSSAWGTPTGGVWIPLGMYGVVRIPLP